MTRSVMSVCLMVLPLTAACQSAGHAGPSVNTGTSVQKSVQGADVEADVDIPVNAGGLAGNYQPNYADGDPWPSRVLVVGVVISLVLTAVGVWKTAQSLVKRRQDSSDVSEEVKEIFRIGSNAIERLIANSDKQTQIQLTQTELLRSVHGDTKLVLEILTNDRLSKNG